jgi:hypothetical protein
MTLRTVLLPIVLILGLVVTTVAGAQTPSLGGEWRVGNRVVIIEQDGAKVTGSWKEAYTERGETCSGLWFEGTISGDTISGTRNTCGARPQPLNAKIVGSDTLEIATLSRGGGGRTTTLRRIK